MKRIIAFVLAAIMVFAISIPAFAEDKAGMKFTTEVNQQISAPEMPLTFEAKIKVNKNAGNGRLGTIVGNYSNNTTVSMNLELRDNGAVALYWNNGSTAPRYDFKQYDIRTGEPVNIAVTIDLATKVASLYVEGELVQSITTQITAVKIPFGFVVGGDLRGGNGQYLKNSELYSVALYSDVRTKEEIKADITAPDLNDSALISAYDLTSDNFRKDLSKNHNDLMKDGEIDYNSAEDPDPKGIYFTADGLLKTKEPIKKMPMTYEAWLKLPKGYNDRGGIIIGNYEGSKACINFEVNTRGNPRIYYMSKNGAVSEQVFAADVRTGDWAHLAIVNDFNNGKAYCYINGELVQTVEKTLKGDVPDVVYCVGGDLRSGNVQYFKGKISSVTLFSDVRTAEEIKADMNGVDSSADNLLVRYELDENQKAKTIEDKSSNKIDLILERNWVESSDKEPLKDYAYSMAVIGDIQIVTERYPEQLHSIFDWIVDNAESHKIKYVFGLGDTTNSDTEKEWTLAKSQFDKFNGVVPYSIVRGNHDSTTKFNKYFGDSEYKDSYFDSYNDKIENTARTLTVGDTKYLIFTLDYGASDAVLKWAGDLCDSNPDCKVIVTTHAYLFRDGTTLDQSDVCPPATTGGSNNGDHIWKKFVSKHSNIVLVLSGHDPCDDVIITQTEAEGGNTVTQMLVDPQGMDVPSPKGMVCMLYFSEDGSNVQVEYYSTIRNQFFRDRNQTSFELPGSNEGPDDPTVTDEPTTPNEPITPDEPTNPGDQKPQKTNKNIVPIIIVSVLIIAAIAAAIAVTTVLLKKKKK